MPRTANPALNAGIFTRYGRSATGERMTVEGTVNKAGFLLLCMVVPAAWMWTQVFQGAPGQPSPAVALGLMGGFVGGLIFSLATIFKKDWAPVTAPLYAVCEGFALGAISAMFNARFQGIVMQAVALTAGVLLVMLFAYRTGMIRATEQFRMMVFAATGAIALVYLATFLLSLFGVHLPYIHQGGTIGILVSLAVVVVASLNLILDFDFIEQGAAYGAPRFMEWYAAFGLMVTLVWLYLEILRLLAILNSRDRR